MTLLWGCVLPLMALTKARSKIFGEADEIRPSVSFCGFTEFSLSEFLLKIEVP